MALAHASTHVGEHGVGAPTARRSTHERDHTEAARERATILNLDERADPFEAVIGLDATDRADTVRHSLRRIVARAVGDDDVARHAGERVGEVRGTAGDVDGPGGARRPGYLLARLRNGFVGDAARRHDGHFSVLLDLGVAVCEQALTNRLLIRKGDLAAEESCRERRHVPEIRGCRV